MNRRSMFETQKENVFYEIEGNKAFRTKNTVCQNCTFLFTNQSEAATHD